VPRPLAFGTIYCIIFHFGKIKRRIGFFFLTIFLLISCASPSDLEPDSAFSVEPTLTPFQPQPANENQSGSADNSPLLEPTFTPYPTQRVSVEIFPTPAILPVGSDSEVNVTNPLTGLPPSDPALLERRPLVIKVANAPDYVRPQSGLTLADVVYEYYIEWGDTRFIAVMYGNDSPYVGPVRSGRYFDEHMAHMYNAFLVFKFADPRELKYLEASDIADYLVVPGASGCPPYVFGPDRGRDSYNNFFFDTIKWAKCVTHRKVDNSRPDLRNGFFADEPAASDLSVDRIFTFFSKYSYNYWDYDPLFHKYFRYQEANDLVDKNVEAYTPLYDAQTGMPVTADNVVMLFVPYTFANQFDAHDEVYHIDLVDSGNAYVFRDGLAYPAKWNRTDVNQPILLTTLSGTPLYLRPGHTFYEVIGVTSGYIIGGTDWKFTFATP
jgi:hypothetical protein